MFDYFWQTFNSLHYDIIATDQISMGQIRLHAGCVAGGNSRQIKGSKIGEQIGTNTMVSGCEEVKKKGKTEMF